MPIKQNLPNEDELFTTIYDIVKMSGITFDVEIGKLANLIAKNNNIKTVKKKKYIEISLLIYFDYLFN